MSGKIQEQYAVRVLAAATTYTNIGGGDKTGVGGFLCVTAGTLTIVRRGNTLNFPTGEVIINALPCTAGVYYPMPFEIGFNFDVTTGTGLTGVLGLA